MQTRRDLLRTSAAALTLAGCGRSESKPNIILIMADDLGYRHLGCYGQRKIRTPNLDRMAAEGLRFTDAYAGCTVCAPSRSARMTGLHTGHTPVRGKDGGLPLPAGMFTMAEMLLDGGYATGIFGIQIANCDEPTNTPDAYRSQVDFVTVTGNEIRNKGTIYQSYGVRMKSDVCRTGPGQMSAISIQTIPNGENRQGGACRSSSITLSSSTTVLPCIDPVSLGLTVYGSTCGASGCR